MFVCVSAHCRNLWPPPPTPRNSQNPDNNKRDLAIAFVLAGVCYLLPGVITLFAFHGTQPDDIQQNFLEQFGKFDVFAFCARVSVFLQVLLFLAFFSCVSALFLLSCWWELALLVLPLRTDVSSPSPFIQKQTNKRVHSSSLCIPCWC